MTAPPVGDAVRSGPAAPGHALDRALRRWVREAPDRPCVEGVDGGSLTFAGTARASAGIATALARDPAAGPGCRVGVMAGRSRYALAALLAVWSRGASAVLLDERLPAVRNREVLADAGCRVVVTPQTDAVPADVRVVDPAGSESADPSAAPRPVAPAPDDEAYLVYTSGSTGRPKGVRIGWSALENFLAGARRLGYRPGGRAVVVVSPAFDGWLWSVLTPFVNGLTCVVLDAETSGFADAVISAGATNLCMTPTLYAAVGALPPVEVAVVAGEPCPPPLADRLRTVADRVLNVYGPTETTIAATVADSARGDDVATIGRPLPGYTVTVVDPDDPGLRPVAPGREGELLIGGAGVGLGYDDAPPADRARFLERDGTRWFRTGDLGRIRADGQIECHGRRDGQTKIGGFRVEYAEVEALARGVDGVRDAVAHPRGEPATLAVGVVAGPDGLDPATVDRLRATFAAHLPRQLRPTALYALDRVPADRNGKVSRAGLVVPETASEPAGTVEGVLSAWAFLFGAAPDGPDTDFYAFGGHSLLAAQLADELGRRFGVELTIVDVLGSATPAAQAALIDTGAGRR